MSLFMALVHWTFAQVILEQKKHQRRLIGSTWWMEVGCFQVLFIISPTLTLTDGGSSKKLNLEIHFPVQRTEKKNRKMLAVWLHFQVFQSIFRRRLTIIWTREETAHQEKSFQARFLFQENVHYCDAVVSLFSDVSHACWKDDKPVLLFILNEQE